MMKKGGVEQLEGRHRETEEQAGIERDRETGRHRDRQRNRQA